MGTFEVQAMGRLAGVRLFIYCVTLFLSMPGHAQDASVLNAPASRGANPSVDRKIELLIRSHFSVPPEYDVVIGARRKSNIDGYDNLPVSFIHEDKKSSVEFLVSTDGLALARLERFDLADNPALSIETSGRPVRGEPTARVEIINFDDLECPYCGMLNNEILPATLDHYRGLVKVVYKDYPLPGHPWAVHAAVDANCLATQSASAYWSYIDYVHSHEQEISGSGSNPSKSFLDLDNIANTFGTKSSVNETQLAMCLKNQDSSLVSQSLKLGASMGLEGTPQVFVDGERLPSGAQPIEKLWPAIDRALKAQGIQPPARKFQQP
jgi:protein-disulfide isomerase